MNKLVITAVVAAIALGTLAETHERRRHEHERTHERGRSHERGKSHERGRHDGRGRMQANPGAKLHRFSTTIEKERPQLNQETRDLIAAYRSRISQCHLPRRPRRQVTDPSNVQRRVAVRRYPKG